MKSRLLLFLAFSLAFSGCTRRKEIWIYTSLSKEVITELASVIEAGVPEASVKWYQSGSDNVASRMDAEMKEGEVKADLVLTSDPFWYLEAKRKGLLLPYESPAAKEVPAYLRDPDHAFSAVRLQLLVLAYNSAFFKPGEPAPERWTDLTRPPYKHRLTMASPLDSPSSYVALYMLMKIRGWEYFAALRKQGLMAEGSHTSVLKRLESGERPIGILPLETALRAGARTRSIRPVYPLDGVIPMPGPIAILKESGDPEVARKVYDWFFGAEAQAAIVRGGVYSSLPQAPVPEGARPWAELQMQLLHWTPELLTEMLDQRDRVRAKFSEVVLH